MNPAAPLSPPQPQAMNWPSWRLILLLMATCFIAHFNRIAIQVAYLRGLQSDYQIDTVQMGMISSSFLWLYTFFMVPGGWLIDRQGPRVALLIVGGGSAIFSVLTGSVGLFIASGTSAFVGLIVVRSLMGISNAPLHPSAARAVSLGVPATRQTLANGFVTGAALLGYAACWFVFPKLIAEVTWPRAFALVGVVALLVAIVWRLFAGKAMTYISPHYTDRSVDQAPSRSETPSSQLSFLRRNKSLILLTLSYAAYGYFQYLFFYWLSYYFKNSLEWSTTESEQYACIPILAMAVGMPFGGWLSDRLLPNFGWRVARGYLAIFGMTTSAMLLFFGTLAKDPFVVVTLLSLALGIIGMLEGSFWVTAIEIGGHRAGLFAGIINTGGNLGGAVQNIMTPFVSDTLKLGWQAGITLGSIVCLIGGLLWIWIDEPRPSPIRSLEPTSDPLPSLAEVEAANQVLRNTPFLPNPA